MSDTMATLANNLARVRERIEAAVRRAGRNAVEVQLVAVTKYVDSDTALALVKCGCRDLGESRPQELWHKAAAMAAADIRWHLIGHLQRNKLPRTLPHVALLHSGDSLRLLQAVSDFGQQHGRRVGVLVEVNVSGDTAKHGFAPDDLPALGAPLASLAWLDVRGLMTMASREGDSTHARREFASLRELRDRLRLQWPETIGPLSELSMGMSGDFEEAIEEGATIVRVGSALFEGLP